MVLNGKFIKAFDEEFVLPSIDEIDISHLFKDDENSSDEDEDGDSSDKEEYESEEDKEEKPKKKSKKKKVKVEEEEDEEDEDEESEDEDEEEEDDDDDDEVKKKKPAKSKYKTYIAKKEKALRAKETEVKALSAEVEKREKAIQDWLKDTDFNNAVEVGKAVKAKDFNKAFEILGFDEADVLEFYGIDDSELSTEAIRSAKHKRDAKEIARQQAQMEQEKVNQRVYNQLSDIVLKTADEFSTLKHFDSRSLVDEVHSAANKLAELRPDLVRGKTLEEVTKMVMEHIDESWSSRVKSIRQASKKAKEAKQNKANKKNVKKEEPKKKSTGTTLSSKKDKASGGSLANLKWSPDIDQDAYDEAVMSQFLQK